LVSEKKNVQGCCLPEEKKERENGVRHHDHGRKRGGERTLPVNGSDETRVGVPVSRSSELDD